MVPDPSTSRVPKPVYEALLGTLYTRPYWEPYAQMQCLKKEVSGNLGLAPEMWIVMNHMASASSFGEMQPGGIETHDAEAKRPQGLLLLPSMLPMRYLNISHAFLQINQAPPRVKSS